MKCIKHELHFHYLIIHMKRNSAQTYICNITEMSPESIVKRDGYLKKFYSLTQIIVQLSLNSFLDPKVFFSSSLNCILTQSTCRIWLIQ